MSDEKHRMVGFGLRIIKEIPEFAHSSITTAVSAILNNRLPYSQPIVGPQLEHVVRKYRGAAAAENVTATVEDLANWLTKQPHGKNHMTWIYPVGIIIMILTGVLLILRLYSRKLIAGRLGTEDWALVMAGAMSLCVTALMENSVNNGGGTYVWDVPWYKIAEFMKCTYMCPYFYTAGVASVKLSLLLFYHRLSQKRSFQICVHLLMAYVCMIFVSTFIAMFFQCRPISDWTNPFNTNCFNVITFWTAYGVLNMTSDVLVWLLPVTVIWKLQMPVWEKVQVILLFGLGLVVCVASTIRIFSLHDLVLEIDVTSGEAPTGLWSLLELNLGVICACIPACKSLASRVWGRGLFSFASWGTPKASRASETAVSTGIQELKIEVKKEVDVVEKNDKGKEPEDLEKGKCDSGTIPRED